MKKSQRVTVAIAGLGALLLLGSVAWNWNAGDGISETPIVVKRSPKQPAAKPVAPIAWRPASASERQRAVASITGQLKAFQKDDSARATYYQSSALKRNFASAEAFLAMIKSMYPDFANYRSADFGGARSADKGRRMEIEVLITGQGGSRSRAVYTLVLEENVFRVSGVQGGTLGHPAPMMPRPDGPGGPRAPGGSDSPSNELFSGLQVCRGLSV